MARKSVPHIVHGKMSACILGGPYAVYYVKGRTAAGYPKVGASVTGIQTPEACDAHAREYARWYDAPIVSPMLCPNEV
jgi:hypothetical protein